MNRIPVLGKVFVFEKSGVFLFATFISFGMFFFLLHISIFFDYSVRIIVS